MKILILGASSYVGARLYLDLEKKFDVVGTFSNNKLHRSFIHLDVTDEKAVKKVIGDIKPDVVLHVANNADPRWCEANPKEAIALNELSSKTIAEAAQDVGAKLVYVSSFAAIEPSNVYGKTKKASEEIIESICDNWVILRPSLIIGFSPNTKNDRPFNRFLKNLDEGTPAQYDNSWKFQPTWLGHLSEITEQVIDARYNNLIIPVAVNEVTTRYQVAKDILEPFGIHVEPIEQVDAPDPFDEDLSLLKSLKLSQHSYSEVIDSITHEIRNRDKFRF